MKRRTFLKLAGASTASVFTAGSAAFYARSIEPSWLDITTIPLSLPHLDSAFHGYRIVQVSDIHIDNDWMGTARLVPILHLVNDLQADLIVITGDFVTHRGEHIFQMLAALNILSARDGVFAVLGNHDHWSGADDVRTMIQAAGIRELRNSVHTITRNGAMLHLVGLDDLWPLGGDDTPSVWDYQPLLRQVIQPLPEQGPAILLVHEPDFADVAAQSKRLALQLSGHTHGGQVRLPFVGALELPPLGMKYASGMYQIDSMQLYTNRGVGMVHPYVRFDCRPEISIFTCSSPP